MQEHGLVASTSPQHGEDELERRVRELVDAYLQQREDQRRRKRKKLAIIATKGTLDFAYPPLILATTAAALGWEVGVFFTFYGLNIIHRDKRRLLQVAPLGNPAMPMPVPNLVGVLPGMTAMATTMMKRMFKRKGVASVQELLELALENEVKLFPCSMTAEVFGYRADDFVEGTQPMCGAAAFLSYASDADISLFI